MDEKKKWNPWNADDSWENCAGSEFMWNSSLMRPTVV